MLMMSEKADTYRTQHHIWHKYYSVFFEEVFMNLNCRLQNSTGGFLKQVKYINQPTNQPTKVNKNQVILIKNINTIFLIFLDIQSENNIAMLCNLAVKRPGWQKNLLFSD